MAGHAEQERKIALADEQRLQAEAARRLEEALQAGSKKAAAQA